MNKRLISLLLVIMMICMLLPMSALAADGVEEQDTGTIAVVVYGKALTNVLDQKTLDAAFKPIVDVRVDVLNDEFGNVSALGKWTELQEEDNT